MVTTWRLAGHRTRATHATHVSLCHRWTPSSPGNRCLRLPSGCCRCRCPNAVSRIHQTHQFGHPTFRNSSKKISIWRLVICSLILCQATVGRTMMRAKHAKATLKPIAFNGAPNVSVERRSPAAQVKRSMRKDKELDKISVSHEMHKKTQENIQIIVKNTLQYILHEMISCRLVGIFQNTLHSLSVSPGCSHNQEQPKIPQDALLLEKLHLLPQHFTQFHVI